MQLAIVNINLKNFVIFHPIAQKLDVDGFTPDLA